MDLLNYLKWNSIIRNLEKEINKKTSISNRLHFKLSITEKKEVKKILSYKKIKVFWLWTDRLGEFILMSLSIIKDLEIYKKKSIYPVFLPLKGNLKNTNMSFYKAFARKYTIINANNIQIWKIIFYRNFNKLNFDNTFYYFSPKKIKNDSFEMALNLPCIKMTVKEKIRAEKKAVKMNLNGSFICFAGRDNSHLSHDFPKEDFTYHNYRNCLLTDFKDSIKYLDSLGITCVLMGKRYEKSNKLNGVNYINYSKEYYDEILDWYLMDNCKFYLGDFGGIGQIPQMLGKPVVFVNFIPQPAPIDRPIFKQEDVDLCITKKLWSIEEKRYLTFEEMWDLVKVDAYHSDFYSKRGLKVIDNTSEEILDVVMEINQRLDGTWVETEQFRDNWETYLKRLRSWCKRKNKSFDKMWKIRIGSMFLEKNKFLLETKRGN